MLARGADLACIVNLTRARVFARARVWVHTSTAYELHHMRFTERTRTRTRARSRTTAYMLFETTVCFSMPWLSRSLLRTMPWWCPPGLWSISAGGGSAGYFRVRNKTKEWRYLQQPRPKLLLVLDCNRGGYFKRIAIKKKHALTIRFAATAGRGEWNGVCVVSEYVCMCVCTCVASPSTATQIAPLH